MNKLLSGRILIAALVLVCVPVSIRAQTEADPERETLRGLDGVMVLVEDLRPDVIADGVTVKMIQTAAEKKLKAAGIKVLSENELMSTPGYPYLYINLNSIKPPGGSGYIYSISLELYQAVTLDRDSKNKCLASTWEVSMVGMVTTSQLKGVVDRISALVDEFMDDYAAANKSVLAPFSAELPVLSYDASFAAQAREGFDFKNYLQPVNWLEDMESKKGISSSLLVDKKREPSGGIGNVVFH